jgi:hypothetical protein
VTNLVRKEPGSVVIRDQVIIDAYGGIDRMAEQVDILRYD